MNKIVIIAVFIFWIAISFFYANSLINRREQGNITTYNTTDANLPITSQTDEVFSLALVAQHNTASDCWVTSGNTVYNVTGYLNAHPGGRDRIIPYCGADITAAFAAQGHSNNAAGILNGLAIGVLGQTISTDPAAITPPPAVNNGRGSDDDEEDDD